MVRTKLMVELPNLIDQWWDSPLGRVGPARRAPWSGSGRQFLIWGRQRWPFSSWMRWLKEKLSRDMRKVRSPSG